MLRSAQKFSRSAVRKQDSFKPELSVAQDANSENFHASPQFLIFSMSGHSKWATIKRQKSVNDQKRGQSFTKLANAITIAVKEGGGIADPQANFKLRLAIEKAREINMPKENIERAISRAMGKQSDELSQLTYEGFGPSGVAFIVEAVTDNPNRTTPQVKSMFEKYGGSMAQKGAVSYLFTTVGKIVLAKNGRSPDEIFLLAAESGAEDVLEEEDWVVVFTKPEMLGAVKESLQKKGLLLENAGLVRKPLTTVPIGDEFAEKIMDLSQKLEALDDVQNVYTNAG